MRKNHKVQRQSGVMIYQKQRFKSIMGVSKGDLTTCTDKERR
jgi:hypothetical protein